MTDENYVTCGSAIKLESADTGYYLNSEEKQLGSGSGQQIVTFIKDAGARSTLWWVRPGHTGDEKEYPPEASCKLAEPITCGSTIRLTHVDTMRNLHSHEVKSPLSSQQEVTAYGQGDAKGDHGDDWIVECSGKYWQRDAVFRLVRHARGRVIMTWTCRTICKRNATHKNAKSVVCSGPR